MELCTAGHAAIKQGSCCRIPDTMEPRPSGPALTSFLAASAAFCVMHFLPAYRQRAPTAAAGQLRRESPGTHLLSGRSRCRTGS